MSDNIKKEMQDSKISTDTLFVLLVAICGVAIICLVGYLLIKPQSGNSDVVIRDIVVSGVVPEESETIESVEDSLVNSYLNDEKTAEDAAPIVQEQPVVVEKKDVPLEEKPIFKPAPKAVVKPTATKTTIVTKPVVKQKLVSVIAYWIQVGSFSSNAQANRSVELLKDRGLSSRVVLSTVNGNDVYRVRIGAYESKEEAEKFLAEVKKIGGFEGSYISESTTQKYVEGK